MSLWRLEWLRLTRTPRAIALAAIFLFIGLIEPIITRYLRDIVGRLSHGTRISLPLASPADGLNSYVSEITLVGLIVVVAVAAGALTFDTRPGISTFLRTRVSSMKRLVLPRFAVTALAASLARSAIGTIGIALAILILIPIAGSIHAIDNWLPSALVNAPAELVGSEHLTHFVPALAVTAAASAAAVWFAMYRLARRET